MEEFARIGGIAAGIAQGHAAFGFRSVLEFDDAVEEAVGRQQHPAIGARIAGLEPDDGDAVRIEHGLDVGGLQQGHVAIGDDHLAVEAVADPEATVVRTLADLGGDVADRRRVDLPPGADRQHVLDPIGLDDGEHALL